MARRPNSESFQRSVRRRTTLRSVLARYEGFEAMHLGADADVRFTGDIFTHFIVPFLVGPDICKLRASSWSLIVHSRELGAYFKSYYMGCARIIAKTEAWVGAQDFPSLGPFFARMDADTIARAFAVRPTFSPALLKMNLTTFNIFGGLDIVMSLPRGSWLRDASYTHNAGWPIITAYPNGITLLIKDDVKWALVVRVSIGLYRDGACISESKHSVVLDCDRRCNYGTRVICDYDKPRDLWNNSQWFPRTTTPDTFSERNNPPASTDFLQDLVIFGTVQSERNDGCYYILDVLLLEDDKIGEGYRHRYNETGP